MIAHAPHALLFDLPAGELGRLDVNQQLDTNSGPIAIMNANEVRDEFASEFSLLVADEGWALVRSAGHADRAFSIPRDDSEHSREEEESYFRLLDDLEEDRVSLREVVPNVGTF